MRGQSFSRRIVLPVLDSVTLMVSFLGAVYLRFGQSTEKALAYENLGFKLFVNALVLQLCLYYADLYADWALMRPIQTAFRFVQAFLGGLLVLLFLYYTVPPLWVGRGVLALFLVIGLVALLSERALFRWLAEEEALGEGVLILGTGATAQQVAREMIRCRSWGLRVEGFLSDDPSAVGRRIVSPTVVGTIDELELLVKRLGISRVVVALDDRRGKLPLADLVRCRMSGVHVEESASVLERLTGQIPTKNLRPSWIVFSLGFHESRVLRQVKRAGELVVAAMAVVALAPLMLLVATLVRLSSPGPVVYSQERVGERGRAFRLLKFRTMRADAEAATGPVWASGDGDPRITAVGRLLRKTRMDELPQLVNVLRGEMSFVGPRPERPHFVDALRQVIPYYDERHSVRPGITGWAQIRDGYGSSIEDAESKLRYDLYYIKHMSLAFDLNILLDTLKVVVIGRGAR